MNPKLSIITVNYNHSATTLEFIKTLQKQSFQDFETILVDNNSIDFDPEIFQSAISNIHIIANKSNLGFAAANNQGMLRASGEFLFFLNFDVLLYPDTLEKLIATWQSLKEPGFLSPVLVFEEAEETIQYAGFTKINRFTGRNKATLYSQSISKLAKEPYPTQYAHGAAIFTSRANIALIGGMPECYFLYYEEMEWSEKIIAAGKNIYVTPSIRIIHKESISVGKNNPLKTYYISRNRILFMKRNRTSLQFLVFWLYWCLFAFPVKCIFALIKLDIKEAKAYIAGTFWHIKKAF